MDWARVKVAMRDELEKIGEISLSGLSPRTVVERGQPAPPMPNAGLDKAMRMLDQLDAAQAMPKVASPHIPFNPDLPQVNRVTGGKKRKKEKPSAVERGKSLGGHIIGGAGAGRFVGEFLHGSKAPVSAAARQAMHGKKYWGTIAGAGVGAAEFARKRIRERIAARKAAKEKKAAAFVSPALQLKNSRQVGAAINRTTLAGPSPRAVTRKAFGGKIP